MQGIDSQALENAFARGNPLLGSSQQRHNVLLCESSIADCVIIEPEIKSPIFCTDFTGPRNVGNNMIGLFRTHCKS